MGLFSAPASWLRYSAPATDDRRYTERMNCIYNWLAPFYNGISWLFPMWRRWIRSVIPFIAGRRILEISFGPGYLMGCYARDGRYEVHGIDYNERMLAIAVRRMKRLRIAADLRRGNVECLAYADESFDTVISTMALTGYPDGKKALAEMVRVLQPGGKLLMVAIDYPDDRNWFGYFLARLTAWIGDRLQDIDALLDESGLAWSAEEIGAGGCVKRYICTKKTQSADGRPGAAAQGKSPEALPGISSL
ncbi:MAG: class I SAM-dependent methyltransferase [Leptospirales bacterium]|nr:class I SAM-dependent methyltransferase [Leptospirales bacterium]